MVFDNEIEEVGGFFGEGGVDVFAGKTLIDGAESAFETVAAGFAEHFAGMKLFAELVDHFHALAGFEDVFGFRTVADTDNAVVVLAEGAESSGVTSDNFEDTISFVTSEFVLGHETLDDAESIADFEETLLREFAETALIDGNAVYDVVFEDFCGPDAKIGGFAGIDAVADGDDGVEVVGFDGAGDLAVALGLNLFQNGTSSSFFKFAFLENMFEMFGNCLYADIEEFGDLGLGGPNSISIIVELELDLLTAGFVNHDLVVHRMLLLRPRWQV